MSEPVLICLIAVSVNLAGMLLVYSFMAFALARFSWRRRGVMAVLATVVIAGQFWILPAMLSFGYACAATPASFALWFGNWLVSGFSVIFLNQTLGSIPRQLEDSARLDGCGVFGIFWHVLLPLVRRVLGLLAVLTLMATLPSFWAAITNPATRGSFVLFDPTLSPSTQITLMMAGSVLATLPLVALFFFGKSGPLKEAESCKF